MSSHKKSLGLPKLLDQNLIFFGITEGARKCFELSEQSLLRLSLSQLRKIALASGGTHINEILSHPPSTLDILKCAISMGICVGRGHKKPKVKRVRIHRRRIEARSLTDENGLRIS